MQQFVVEANVREERGKNAARRRRLQGEIPAVLYGGKGSAVAVSVNAKQIASILRSEAGHNTIFTLKISGQSENKALLKDWQVDPIKGHLLHVDLLRVAMDVKMRVKVPVQTYGDPEGVKLQGGIFETVTRDVEIECLPGDIPDGFRVDVSHLTIGKHLRVGDLPLDAAKHTLITDAQRVIAHVVALKKEEEVAPEVAAAEVAAAPAEPEVIKKGKKEEEGEEGEAAAPAEKGEKKK